MGGGRGLRQQKQKEKGMGVGRVAGGVGTGQGTGKSMRTRLSKRSFSKLPFSISPVHTMEVYTAIFLGNGLQFLFLGCIFY